MEVVSLSTVGEIFHTFVWILVAAAAVAVPVIMFLGHIRHRPTKDSEPITRADLDREITRLEDAIKDISGGENITRAELDRETSLLKTAIKDSENSTRANTDRLENSIKELQAYSRERIHTIANNLHVLNIRAVYNQGLMIQLCAKQGIPVPQEPQVSPVDEP